MDRGHERTEQVINKIEGRLRAEYEQAAQEVEKTLKDYMERFALKDKKWQEWVKDGKRTQEQYDAWRKQQLMQGERWKQLKNQLAEDMVNTTSAARDIVQSYMPEVYEINANYALYQVEVGGGYTLPSSLTLYNREAIARLVKDEPDLMPMGKGILGDIARGKAERWERQKVQSIMMQGILQGKSNVRIAQDIAENLANGDFKASMRYARTMSTNAQNGGRYGAYRRLEENGVPLTLQWEATLDMRTRHEHRMMHGQRRNVNQPFEVDGVEILYPAWLGMGDYKVPPDMIWNCFVGNTNVATDSEIQKSYKHKYLGEVVTINTSSGINFTCTPNHPILTPRGWVAAALLNEGDDLLVTSGADGAVFRGNGNVNHVHTTMQALHKTLADFGGIVQAPVGNFNFHGDIPASDVEVVCKEGELGVNLDTRIANSINKPLLKNPDTLSSGKGHFMSRFGGIDVSTLGFVSRIRKALSLLGRRVRHTDKHCFGTVAGGDAILTEYPVNNLPAETVIRSNLLNGLTRGVFVDNIVSVNKSFASCHVYNLQTENGYYFVGNSITDNGESYNGNMVIAKNCRCTILAFVKGFEHDALKTSERMGGLSYEDWLNAKERPDPITKQRDIGEMMRMRYIREYGGDGSGLRKEKPKVEYKQLASGDEANRKPDPFKGPDFTPAKTTEEAEAFAGGFISGGYKSVVNYKGVDLEYANEFNRAFNDVLAHYDPQYKLRSIQPMNMRDKRFKGTTADAAYQWGLNDLFFNKAYFKSKKEFEKHLAQHKNLMDQVLPHVDALIERFKGQTGFAAKKQLEYAEALKASGRSNVSGADPYGTMVHEIGHYLDDMLFRKEMKVRGFDLSASYASYAKNISAYAAETANEYVAESFAAYWKGERDNLDPDLIAIFEGTRK